MLLLTSIGEYSLLLFYIVYLSREKSLQNSGSTYITGLKSNIYHWLTTQS